MHKGPRYHARHPWEELQDKIIAKHWAPILKGFTISEIESERQECILSNGQRKTSKSNYSGQRKILTNIQIFK